MINTRASDLEPTVIDARPAAFQQPLSGPAGGFFNYDLLYQGDDSGRRIANGTVEMGLFNALGVGTTRFLGRGLDNPNRIVRLNSSWRYDWPRKLETLRLGDTFSRPGPAGRSVQFGGIQWGTNFGTQPDFVTFPRPTLRGETAVPGEVELYANGLRQTQRSVDAGPFSVRDVPVAVGQNNLRVVVRDVLGREHVISQPFYASRDLLKKGLGDFSYSAGFIRRNYSLKSNDYGDGFISGNHRLGLSNDLTGGARLELQRDHQTAGVSTVTSFWPALGVLSASVAGSIGHDGPGGLANIGLERQGRRFSYSAQSTWTSPDFRQLGLPADRAPPQRTSLVRLGAQLFGASSASVSYVSVDQREGGDASFVNASYSVGLAARTGLSVFVSHDLVADDTAIGATITMALGSRTSASVSHSHDPQSERNQVEIQRNLPRGSALGYRVSAANGDAIGNRGEADLAARSRYGTYHGQVAQTGSDTAYRVSAQGGGAVLGGNLFASRQVRDSFGVVEVGDYPGVAIYQDNQAVARTNDNGAAFIPDMRAFDKNRISFAQQDLPLGVQIKDQERTAIPGYRHGALVKFDVSTSQGALIKIVRENGDPVPAGATVNRVGHDKRFPVARRGQAWVTGLARKDRLQARWGKHRCGFKVELPENPGPLPRIGPVVCRARKIKR